MTTAASPTRSAEEPPPASEGGVTASSTPDEGAPAPHDESPATPEAWREANRRLLAKALGEWCFEDMLKAVETAPGTYQVELDSGVRYGFRAAPGAFGWLRVDPASITRVGAGMLGNEISEPAWDALQFVNDVHSTLGTDASTLSTYLTELSATLAADARRLAYDAETVADLRKLGHAELETRMTGHAWMVANKGRVGFSATDVASYAPESRQPVRLIWLAVHRGLAEFRGTPELSEQAVLARELDPETRQRFASRLDGPGVGHPDSYVWLPVHPWQWDHAIQPMFAGEIAQRRIVRLGDSPDRYLPGQSIRTMANLDHPQRYDVKLPLKILNTLVWRGIPPHCTAGAPPVTQWLRGLLDSDPYLTEQTRTVFMGEVASVTVHHPYLSRVPEAPYQYLETLGCIWREPVAARKDPDERVRTFASLLHTDTAGTAFVAELVRASGLAPTEWLTRLFTTVLHPVMHVLYRYGITFNPHGQNTLIGYDDNDVPTRLYLKDFVDDVCVSFTPVPERGPEPDSHHHVLPRKHPSVIKQHVVDPMFVGHFRYLSPLCAEQLGVPEKVFWGLVRRTVLDFQADFARRYPGLEHRFAEYDLLAPDLPRYAVNRDRLVVTRYGDRALRHALYPNGTIPNPLSVTESDRTIDS